MWFERFVIVVISLHREFLPSNWDYFRPTWVDICTYLGTFGLFFTVLPVVHTIPADDRHL
jgi:molybdopterin-containing oxidoreductase family membrane subunit